MLVLLLLRRESVLIAPRRGSSFVYVQHEKLCPISLGLGESVARFAGRTYFCVTSQEEEDEWNGRRAEMLENLRLCAF